MQNTEIASAEGYIFSVEVKMNKFVCADGIMQYFIMGSVCEKDEMHNFSKLYVDTSLCHHYMGQGRNYFLVCQLLIHYCVFIMLPYT